MDAKESVTENGATGVPRLDELIDFKMESIYIPSIDASCGGPYVCVCCWTRGANKILANIKLTNINLFAKKISRAYVRLVAAAAATVSQPIEYWKYDYYLLTPYDTHSIRRMRL